jgi:hypothetical protein
VSLAPLLQLETLRRSLDSAARRLSARSRHLVAQYQRDQMLSDTLRLLDDIQACLQVPARLQRLEEGREWPLAVSLLLDACNKLARQELAGVGALRELGEEMGRRRDALQDSLVAELEARAYRTAPPGAAAALAGRQGDPGALAGSGGAAAAGVPRLALSALQPRSSSQEGELSAGAGNLSGRGLPPRAPPPGPLGRTASWGWDGCAAGAAAAGGAAGDQLASLVSLPRRPTHRRAQTLGALAAAAPGLTSVDGHLVEAELPLAGGWV